jgi:hypothetical protein
MWCTLERAGSTQDVHVKISDFHIEKKSNGWRFAGGYGAKLVVNHERNHPHLVRWDYTENQSFPGVRISYDHRPDGLCWFVGNGLTSGVVHRETPQSGSFAYTEFNVLGVE